ncbi:hypothetical protein M501DRAFT_920745, partial [Patellaria atrata CBS 101060]
LKRARPQLSCTPCRQGKLKCNRVHPVCDQCLKRARENACVYVAPPAKNANRTANMRERIRQLEKVVVTLMEQPQNAQGDLPTPPTTTEAAGGVAKGESGGITTNTTLLGKMNINNGSNNETVYTGGSHWAAILEDLSDFRTYLEGEQETQTEPMSFVNSIEGGPEYPFGNAQPGTKESILQSLPAKPEVDRLMTLWFNSQDPFKHIIHGPTFQNEYKEFWKEPAQTPTIWLALLCSILALGTLARHRLTGGDQPPRLLQATLEPVLRFQHLSASAMALCNISKPSPYTIQALMIFMESELLLNDKAEMRVYLLMGLILRLCLHMGYHREPSHYKNISHFHGEMRRRTWYQLFQIDILVSFMLGLPSNAHSIQHDVQPPRNIFDHEFSLDSKDLPPSRPVDELTALSYCISKQRYCTIFGKAAEISHAITPPEYSTILELDNRLDKFREILPVPLRIKPLGMCIMDPPDLIMNRFNLELLYQKTRCILHRRYMINASPNTQMAYSRRTCVEAAMNMLKHHQTVVEACEPAGQLGRVRWYMSSLTTHDFLLASMVICLELQLRYRAAENSNLDGGTLPGSPLAKDMLDAIDTSHQLWKRAERPTSDVVKACQMLERMLKK